MGETAPSSLEAIPRIAITFSGRESFFLLKLFYWGWRRQTSEKVLKE